ncbi:MAG: hypothetical protein WKF73_06680 [Nocardioidaceae bacterium]
MTKSPSAAARSTGVRLPNRSPQGLQLLIHVIVAHHDVFDFHLDAFIVGQHDGSA